MPAPKKKPQQRAAAASSDPSWGIARSIVSANMVERDPYRGHATVYRCIRVIVGALMRVPLIPKKGQRPNGVAQESGPWAELMLRPNPNQTRRQLVEATGTYLLTTGECLWYLEGRDGPAKTNEIPEQIWPLPKAAAEPIVDEKTRTVVLGWRITTRTGAIEVPATSVLQFKYSFDPANPLRGLGPIGVAATAMRADMKAEAWGEAFFDNAAEPGGVLSTDGVLTPKQREDMRMAWESKHGGVSKRGRVAVLEGGLEYQQIGISQRDMDYLEQRKWNDQVIAKAFGVPGFMLGNAQDISYASTRQAKRALWELAVLPIVDMMEDVLEARMTSTRDASIWLEFDVTKVEALKEDLAANLDSAQKLAMLGFPVNQINERLDLGMQRQDWGDEGTLPMGVAPATTVVPLPEVETQAGAADATGATEASTVSETAFNGGQVQALVDTVKAIVLGEIPAEAAKQILLVAFPLTDAQATAIVNPSEQSAVAKADAAAEAVAAGGSVPGQPGHNGLGGNNGKAGNPDALPQQDKPPETNGTPPAGRGLESRDRRAAYWTRVNKKIMQPSAQRFRARVRSWMNARRGEILRFMEGAAKTRAEGDLPGEFLRELEKFLIAAEARWSELLDKQTAGVYREIFRAASADMMEELGKVGFVDMGDPAVAKFMAEKAVKIKGVSDTVIEGIRKTLAEGVVEQDNLVELQDRVRDVFRAGNSRAQTIAQTETSQATNGARQLVMEQEGVKQQEWMTSEDAFVRDETGDRKNGPANHRELDGKVVPVGASFVDGIRLHYPSDPAAPAQWVVNCRCLAAPVLEDRGIKPDTRAVEPDPEPAPAPLPPEIHVHIPADAIRINMPAPVVTVAPPVVEVKPASNRTVEIQRDADGRITGASVKE